MRVQLLRMRWSLWADSESLLTHFSYNDELFFSELLLVIMFYRSDREVSKTLFEKEDLQLVYIFLLAALLVSLGLMLVI